MSGWLSTSLVLYLASVNAWADTAGPLPADAFFGPASVSSAKISPDGKFLAMVVSDNETGKERKYLSVIGSNDKKIKSGFAVADGHEIWNFWWVNDERVIIATATETGALAVATPDGSLYGINVDKSQALQLLGEKSDMADTPADSKPGEGEPVTGSHVVIRAAVPAKEKAVKAYSFDRMLFIPSADTHHAIIQAEEQDGYQRQALDLDVYTGEVKVLIKSPVNGGGFETDNDGNVRLAWGADELDGTPAIFYRDSSDEAKWKDLSALYKDTDPAGYDCGPDGMAPNGNTFYWYCRTPQETLGLYDVDPRDLSRKVVFADPLFDVEDVLYDFFGNGRGDAIVAVTMPGKPEFHVLDPKNHTAGVLGALDQAFPGETVDITSSTRDGSLMMVFVSSDRNPGDYYLFNSKTLKADYLFSALENIDPDKMSFRQPITLTARDGLLLHGYLTAPLGKDAKHLPMIVLPHGGPHGVYDVWGWDSEAQFLANNGYAVLQVNFRGSGGYGMAFQDLGYHSWGTSMQDDLADSVKWAVEQGIADPNRVCIYGASYGGYSAIESVIRYPNLYKCAVGYVGVYDLTLQGEYSDTSRSVEGRNYLSVVLGHDKKELHKYSPVYNADLINVPVFIAYGGKDQRVVPDNARRLMDAMDKAGKKYEVLFKPYEVHGFQKTQDKIEFYTEMLHFIEKYIGAEMVPTRAVDAPASGKKPSYMQFMSK